MQSVIVFVLAAKLIVSCLCFVMLCHCACKHVRLSCVLNKLLTYLLIHCRHKLLGQDRSAGELIVV